KGSAGGNIAIRGSFNKPLLKGNLNLKSTSVKVPYLNAAFVIQNENFIIEEDWMGFNHIAIKDENGQIAYATGTINHENFDNLNFDVYLQTKNFFMLNTNSLQNPMFYGQAYVTGNVGMSGYTDQLDLDINVKTEKGTKLFVPLSGA